jgi:hypothetical protein
VSIWWTDDWRFRAACLAASSWFVDKLHVQQLQCAILFLLIAWACSLYIVLRIVDSTIYEISSNDASERSSLCDIVLCRFAWSCNSWTQHSSFFCMSWLLKCADSLLSANCLQFARSCLVVFASLISMFSFDMSRAVSTCPAFFTYLVINTGASMNQLSVIHWAIKSLWKWALLLYSLPAGFVFDWHRVSSQGLFLRWISFSFSLILQRHFIAQS